jgi:hypothetical protein
MSFGTIDQLAWGRAVEPTRKAVELVGFTRSAAAVDGDPLASLTTDFRPVGAQGRAVPKPVDFRDVSRPTSF